MVFIAINMTNNLCFTHDFGYFATFAESLHCKGVWGTVHDHSVDLHHSVIFTGHHHEILLVNALTLQKVTDYVQIQQLRDVTSTITLVLTFKSILTIEP